MSDLLAEPAEPTTADVLAALEDLPAQYLLELARGPLHDPLDADACRICELFDSWVWGHSPLARWERDEGGELYLAESGPYDDAVLTLLGYHRFYADDGRGALAYARCLEIYAAAARLAYERSTLRWLISV